MLRISQICAVQHAVTLRLEGRLVGPWVAELQRSCDEALANSRALSLDMSEMQYMDANGVELLSRLKSRGVALLECSAFAFEQLKTAPGRA